MVSTKKISCLARGMNLVFGVLFFFSAVLLLMSFTFTKYYIQRIVPCEMSFEVMLSMYLLDSTSFDSAITGEYTESLHQMKFYKQLRVFFN